MARFDAITAYLERATEPVSVETMWNEDAAIRNTCGTMKMFHQVLRAHIGCKWMQDTSSCYTRRSQHDETKTPTEAPIKPSRAETLVLQNLWTASQTLRLLTALPAEDGKAHTQSVKALETIVFQMVRELSELKNL